MGDFGLATSSLAAVDPSDVSPHAVVLDADMTLGVWFCPCASFPTGVDNFFFFRMQRSERGCTSLQKSNRGIEVHELGTMTRLICTV